MICSVCSVMYVLLCMCVVFFFKQRTAYVMRISDWSSDVCSSDLVLYRDAHLLIADKPHFLPVVPSGRFVQQTLLVRLKRETGVDGLAPLHRIDRATAGQIGRASCRERVWTYV